MRRTASVLLEALGEGGSTVAISLVGDRAIRRLNADHRGRDRATDVLSFSLIEPIAAGEAMTLRAPPGTERQLGDIVISLDTAARQAGAYNVSLAREIERLMIHGLLHLLGHDHENAADRRRMTLAEKKLAKAINLPWPENFQSGR